MSFKKLHVVIVAHFAWTHIKPLCALAAHMVRLRPVDVTFFVSVSMHAKTTAEIARSFEEDEEALQSRIRIIGLAQHDDMFDMELFPASVAEQFKKLLDGEPVHCLTTNSDVADLPRPHAVIFDCFEYNAFLEARRLSNGSIPFFAAGPGSLAVMNAIFGPFTSSSHGELQGKVEARAKETGESLMIAARNIVASPDDEIVQPPGFPKMYKYEWHPQEMIIKAPIVGTFHLHSNNLFHEADGVLFASSAPLEPVEAVRAIDDFYAANSGKAYLVGLLNSASKRAAKIEMEHAAKSPEIMAFLDQTLQKHGKNSLIYIAFGHLFWPTEQEKLWTFLDVLMEKRVPFIMSYASPFAKVPEEVLEKVGASDTGMMVPWAPQNTVLKHPSTGWFVTHGGFNSITETIEAGVPMICWPFAADQPLNAIQLTDNLDVAFELLEVRNNHGLKPIYRTGKTASGTLEALRAEAGALLEKAFGEDGARKRANVLKLQEACGAQWKEGGNSRLATEQFLDSL